MVRGGFVRGEWVRCGARGVAKHCVLRWWIACPDWHVWAMVHVWQWAESGQHRVDFESGGGDEEGAVCGAWWSL